MLVPLLGHYLNYSLPLSGYVSLVIPNLSMCTRFPLVRIVRRQIPDLYFPNSPNSFLNSDE